jgi:hypothetical protein
LPGPSHQQDDSLEHQTPFELRDRRHKLLLSISGNDVSSAIFASPLATGGDRTERLFQFLNLIEARALSRHLGRVQEMAEDFADGWECEAKIARRFGFEQQLELRVPLPVPAQQGVAN